MDPGNRILPAFDEICHDISLNFRLVTIGYSSQLQCCGDVLIKSDFALVRCFGSNGKKSPPPRDFRKKKMQ
jgi:hypothetical protein